MQPMATDKYGVLKTCLPNNTLLTAYPLTLKQLQSQWKATHSIFRKVYRCLEFGDAGARALEPFHLLRSLGSQRQERPS